MYLTGDLESKLSQADTPVRIINETENNVRTESKVQKINDTRIGNAVGNLPTSAGPCLVSGKPYTAKHVHPDLN